MAFIVRASVDTQARTARFVITHESGPGKTRQEALHWLEILAAKYRGSHFRVSWSDQSALEPRHGQA